MWQACSAVATCSTTESRASKARSGFWRRNDENGAAPSKASNAIADSFSMRRAALQRGIPYCTTLAAARASADAIAELREESIGVRSLQEIHARI